MDPPGGAPSDAPAINVMVRQHSEYDRERDRREFASQSNRIRKQLKAMEACTLNPYGKFMQRWDQLTMFALIFVAFVTPFEVALLEATWEEMLPLFIINRLVDLTFLIDIGIQFFVPYRNREGLVVYKNSLMAWNYIRGSFFLDLIASVPYDSIMGAVSSSGGGNELRVLKMLRIIKLARILRASRILKRWEAYLGLSHAVLKMIEFAIITAVMAHWLACLWAFVGRMGPYSEVLETDPAWAAAFPGVPYTYPGPLGPTYAYRHHSWIQKAGMYDAQPFELYGVSLYVALSNMFASGATPSPANYSEFYVQCLMMFFGSSVWAYIIGAGCGIIATLDPQGVEFRQTMDELNYFAQDKKLPQQLTLKLRTFFQNTKHVIFARQYDDLLLKMSPLLRGEAALRVARQSIGKLPYFSPHEVESAFLATAALKMKVAIYSLREYVPIQHLTIIERGIAAKEGRLKIKGGAIGMDMILTLPHLRDWAPVIALTVVCQVMTLSKEDLKEILPESPKAARKVRSAAYKLAFQRLVVRVAEEYRTSQLGNKDSPTKGLLRLDMPDAVHRAHQRALKSMPASAKEQNVRDLFDRATPPVQGGKGSGIVIEEELLEQRALYASSMFSRGTVQIPLDDDDEVVDRTIGTLMKRPARSLPTAATPARVMAVGGEADATRQATSTPSQPRQQSWLPFFSAGAPEEAPATAAGIARLTALLEGLSTHQESLMEEVRACREDISKQDEQMAFLAKDVQQLKSQNRVGVNRDLDHVLSKLQA